MTPVKGKFKALKGHVKRRQAHGSIYHQSPSTCREPPPQCGCPSMPDQYQLLYMSLILDCDGLWRSSALRKLHEKISQAISICFLHVCPVHSHVHHDASSTHELEA
eukprot:3147821-Amphidinium_carterae.1